MSDRDRFLRALAENEDDTTLRVIFADWLDEHGEHEEADRQRKWPAAKDWFVRICQEQNPPPEEDDPYPSPISCEELIERGREAVEDFLSTCLRESPYESLEQMLVARSDELKEKLIEPEYGWEFVVSCGNNLGLQEVLYENVREFWKNLSIVAGIPLPPGIEERSRFHCSC